MKTTIRTVRIIDKNSFGQLEHTDCSVTDFVIAKDELSQATGFVKKNSNSEFLFKNHWHEDDKYCLIVNGDFKRYCEALDRNDKASYGNVVIL